MKAWELNEMESLQQAVESAEPKLIFLKVLKQLEKRDKKRDVLQMLGIDVQKSNPTYIHKHFPYKRKEYKDNMFIYVDKQYRIMGFLRGTERELDWERLEHWDAVNNISNQGYSRVDIVKNKKNLWEQAYHILMIDKSELGKVSVKKEYQISDDNNIKAQRKNWENMYKKNLSEKLSEYRKKKYKNLIYDNYKNNLDSIMWDCLMKIKELSNNKNKSALKELRKMFNCSDEIRDSDLVKKVVCHCFDKDNYNEHRIYIDDLKKLKSLYKLLFNKELPNALKVKKTLYVCFSEPMKNQS
jgi:hypothetical protein